MDFRDVRVRAGNLWGVLSNLEIFGTSLQVPTLAPLLMSTAYPSVMMVRCAAIMHRGALHAMPRVSVIVPNFNHERFLRRRLAGIIEQSYTDFEILLLDDCSTDNS